MLSDTVLMNKVLQLYRYHSVFFLTITSLNMVNDKKPSDNSFREYN